MSEKIINDLVVFLRGIFLVERDEINLEESLIDQGVIDSFGLIESSSFIEERYGFTIEDDDMNPENFGSALRITKLIKDRLWK